MPIKNLTDKDSIVPRFSRLGKLRKGGPKTASGFGKDLAHFRFTSDWPGAEEAFLEAYGEAPKQVNAYLPYRTTEQCFPSWMEEWSAGGLQHRCDGVTCVLWLGKDAQYHQEPVPCPGGCSQVGRLEVVVPEMIAAGFVGIITLETHSKNDLISITETLAKTEQLRGDNPLGLQGILFNLRRVEEEISVPGFGKNVGKRQRVRKSMVKLEPAVDWVAAQMIAARADIPALMMTVDNQLTELDDWDDTEELNEDDARALAKDHAHWREHRDRLETDPEYAVAFAEKTAEAAEALFPPVAELKVVELKPEPAPAPLYIQPPKLDALTPDERELLDEMENALGEPEPAWEPESGQQAMWEVEPEPPAEAGEPAYPTKSWAEFRDYVTRTLPKYYRTGKVVAAALGEAGITHPWLHWSVEQAAECWACLTKPLVESPGH